MTTLSTEQIDHLKALTGCHTSKSKYKDVGCYNWALTGCARKPVSPMDMFNYMNREAQAADLGLTGGDKQAYFDLVLESCKNPSDLFDGSWFNTTEHLAALNTIGQDFHKTSGAISQVEAITRVMKVAITANGLTAASGESNYHLSMYYIKADGASVQHVWIDIAKTSTIEIFPGLDRVQMYKGWQLARKPHWENTYGRIDIPLTGLQQGHVDVIKAAFNWT